MKLKPTARNLWLFAIAYQIYPVLLYFGIRQFNPDPKPWAVALMVAIAEAVLIFWILSWRRGGQIEAMDEREALILLRVRTMMLHVTWTAMGLVFTLHIVALPEIKFAYAFGFIAICMLTTEQIANWYYRRI